MCDAEGEEKLRNYGRGIGRRKEEGGGEEREEERRGRKGEEGRGRKWVWEEGRREKKGEQGKGSECTITSTRFARVRECATSPCVEIPSVCQMLIFMAVISVSNEAHFFPFHLSETRYFN